MTLCLVVGLTLIVDRGRRGGKYRGETDEQYDSSQGVKTPTRDQTQSYDQAWAHLRYAILWVRCTEFP